MRDQIVVAHIHPGEICTAFQVSLDESYGFDSTSAQQLHYPPLRNQCGVDLGKGRNEVVSVFLSQTDAAWLMFVDSDMGWEPDAIERLRASADPVERPVVGGLCFGHKRAALSPQRAWRHNLHTTMYKWVARPDEVGFQSMCDWPRGEMVRVGATGAAFLLIHRSVLVAIADKLGETWFDNFTHPTGPKTFGEDMSFCLRVAAVDVPIFVNTDVQTSHEKRVCLDLWAFDSWPRIEHPDAAKDNALGVST